MWLADILIYCGIPFLAGIMGVMLFGPIGILLGPFVLGAGLLLGNRLNR